MKTKRKRKSDCTSPLEIGKTYHDSWGRPHKMLGQACYLFNRPIPGVLYSSSDHVEAATGLGEAVTLINLPREEELAYFEKQWKTIHDSNPPDKLKLVKYELECMAKHIEELRNPEWKR